MLSMVSGKNRKTLPEIIKAHLQLNLTSTGTEKLELVGQLAVL